MGQFLKHHAAPAVEHLHYDERPPASTVCSRCSTQFDRAAVSFKGSAFRCRDCWCPPTLCHACTLSTHSHLPSHRVMWYSHTAQQWNRQDLGQIGFEIHLGHDGEPCPDEDKQGLSLCLVHENGMTDVEIKWCRCRNAQTHPNQLIDAGMWPASWLLPQTAFTLNLLRNCQLLSLQSQTTLYDYYQYLARMKDNVAPHLVTVRDDFIFVASPLPSHSRSSQNRYQELLRAMREFQFVRLCKRKDVKPSLSMDPGALVTRCPACPQVGINMAEGWQTAPESER